MMNRCKSSKT